MDHNLLIAIAAEEIIRRRSRGNAIIQPPVIARINIINIRACWNHRASDIQDIHYMYT
jgi:hypothetical protein